MGITKTASGLTRLSSRPDPSRVNGAPSNHISADQLQIAPIESLTSASKAVAFLRKSLSTVA
jgi:hypothetical protein